MKPEREGTMSYEERRRFAVGVLKGIGAPTTPGNVEFLLAWMSRENTQAENNPMATTFPSEDSTPFNYLKDEEGEFVLDKDGNKIPLVKNYPDFNEGVRATAVSLLGYSRGNLLSDREVAEELGVDPRYPVVLDLLRQGTDRQEIIDNAEATKEIEKWGSFVGRVGYGAEDTWGYTLEELEALAPGELEQLNTETLRPIKGYEFPDPTGSFAVEENEYGERVLDSGKDVLLADPNAPQAANIGRFTPKGAPDIVTSLNDPGARPDIEGWGTTGITKAQFDEEIERIRAVRDARVGDDPSVPPWVFSEEEEAAMRAARNELREGGTTDLPEEQSAALREELLAQPRMVRESYTKDEEEVFFEAIQMDEAQSNLFLDALLGVDSETGETDPENALTNEEAKFIRDNIGQVAFWWQQDREDLMVDTPDGRRMNIVDWIIEHEGQMPDEQILLWMNQTEYFQNHKDAIRKRDALWHTAGPGVRQQLLEDPRGELLREAQRIGFNWLEDNPALLDKLAYDSYRFGWDEYDRRRALAGITPFEPADVARGTILANRQTALDSAAKYYMPLSAEGADDLAWGMYLGEETSDSVEAMYREQAKGQFPSLAGLIDQGVSMQAYFDPYKQRIGQLLEMSDVDLMNDPRLQPIMFPGAGGGPMSLSEAQTFTRSLPEWQYTKNAEDAARSMVDNVGRMMGVVA